MINIFNAVLYLVKMVYATCWLPQSL